MDRRKFIGLVSSGVAATTVAAGTVPKALAANGAASGAASSQPNFLFMICDDLMFRTIHSLNNKEVRTPNLDRMVRTGCAFTHSFQQGSWVAAVCMPSRMKLNTGLTAFHVQAGANDVNTWGQTFGAAGYDTYICGKWHMNNGDVLLARSFKEMGTVGPAWFPSTGLDGKAFGDAYNRPSPGNTWEPWDTSQKGQWLHLGLWRDKKPDRIQHSAEMYADQVVEHLEQKVAKRDTPFFMYVGWNSPHDPRQAPKEYVDMYPQDKIEVPPNFLPEHPFNQGDHKVRDELLAPFPRTREAVQLHRREYYAHITYLDVQIGRILDALERTGKASNTYVILTADHGLAVGEHGLMGKQNMYDHSLRIPLLITGPGIKPGSQVDELVYQHCLYATTCELAGLPIPSTVEFKSLAPMLRGDTTPVYDAVFSYYRDFQRMVRTKKHKLIVYPQVKKMQVFDIEKDPWEMHDLSDDPAYADVKADLMKRLKQLQAELDDPLDLDHPRPQKDLTLEAPGSTK
ncbi:MAG: sulfatase-like hydrolase/transferase [Acidobacteriaceae bacterium]|nr:sulfatase-like hydrolase/transferase [Acidobacteriaceae bacterium]